MFVESNYTATCSTHRLCGNCSILITEESKQAYLSIVACKECKQSINSKFYSSQETQMSNIREKMCIMCDQRKNCINLCDYHSYCKKCLSAINLNSKMLVCNLCKKSLKERCMQCMNTIDIKIQKLKIPTCNLSHSYCKDCYNKEIITQNPDCCKFCKDYLLSKFSKLLMQECKKCECEKVCVILNCGDSYCIKCVNSYDKKALRITSCQICNKMYDESCKRCFKSISPPRIRIANPLCKLNHFYCDECFIESALERDKSFCYYCKQLYEHDEKRHSC